MPPWVYHYSLSDLDLMWKVLEAWSLHYKLGLTEAEIWTDNIDQHVYLNNNNTDEFPATYKTHHIGHLSEISNKSLLETEGLDKIDDHWSKGHT